MHAKFLNTITSCSLVTCNCLCVLLCLLWRVNNNNNNIMCSLEQNTSLLTDPQLRVTSTTWSTAMYDIRSSNTVKEFSIGMMYGRTWDFFFKGQSQNWFVYKCHRFEYSIFAKKGRCSLSYYVAQFNAYFDILFCWLQPRYMCTTTFSSTVIFSLNNIIVVWWPLWCVFVNTEYAMVANALSWGVC